MELLPLLISIKPTFYNRADTSDFQIEILISINLAKIGCHAAIKISALIISTSHVCC